uniref:Uncharacterized protein n=1 Tax=Klebsiella pneumoniae TaxID=573 RepID=A0A2P1BP67_KLEPN|nr:hypothetical protein [Klebsiella pneumoniae]
MTCCAKAKTSIWVWIKPMLDLLNLPCIKPVDMRHEGKCLVIVAEPVTVEVPLCGECNIPMHRHGTRKTSSWTRRCTWSPSALKFSARAFAVSRAEKCPCRS